MQAFFKAGNILRSFVAHTRNRIRIIEKFAGRFAAAVAFEERGVLSVPVSRGGRVTVLDDLENLTLNDATDSVEIGPASALDFVCVDGFSPNPKKHRDGGEHDEPNRWN